MLSLSFDVQKALAWRAGVDSRGQSLQKPHGELAAAFSDVFDRPDRIAQSLQRGGSITASQRGIIAKQALVERGGCSIRLLHVRATGNLHGLLRGCLPVDAFGRFGRLSVLALPRSAFPFCISMLSALAYAPFESVQRRIQPAGRLANSWRPHQICRLLNSHNQPAPPDTCQPAIPAARADHLRCASTLQTWMN